MEKKKVFCPECRNDVDYIVNDVPMNGTLRGETYSYIGKEARCKNCNTELFIDEINDYNLKALYDELRRSKNIISLDKILEISKKYAIGKRPLSRLLGWGEQTFTRYCDGDIPTRQYSDILQKIYDDPRAYEKILESNKDVLSEQTYKKSQLALKSLLNGSTDKEDSKMDIAIRYILNTCEDITPLALQKALYYIQGFYYAFYQRFIFDEDCQAWVHGPVYRDVYYRYKEYHFEPIDCEYEIGSDTISTTEKAIFDSVARHICCYSGKVLEQFTHSEAPWIDARGDLLETEPSERVISKESIGEYFESIKEKFNMINPNDISEYAQTMFATV